MAKNAKRHFAKVRRERKRAEAQRAREAANIANAGGGPPMPPQQQQNSATDAATQGQLDALQASVDAMAAREKARAKEAADAADRKVLDQARAIVGDAVTADTSALDAMKMVCRAAFPHLRDKVDAGGVEYVRPVFDAAVKVGTPNTDSLRSSIAAGSVGGGANTSRLGFDSKEFMFDVFRVKATA